MTKEDKLVRRLLCLNEKYLELLNFLAANPGITFTPKELIANNINGSAANCHDWLYACGITDYVTKQHRQVEFFVTQTGQRIFRKMGLPKKIVEVIKPEQKTKIIGTEGMLKNYIRENPNLIGCKSNTKKYNKIYENLEKVIMVDLILPSLENEICLIELKVSAQANTILQAPGQVLKYCAQLRKSLSIEIEKIRLIIIAPGLTDHQRILFCMANSIPEIEAYELTKFFPEHGVLEIEQLDLEMYKIS